MATKAGDITFGVGFQVDKTGLQQVQQQLQQLQSGLKTTDIMKINNSSLQEAIQQLTKIQSTAQDVQNAMTKAFNPKIGSLNLSKFQSELKTAGHSIESIYKDFNMAGAAGQAAFRGVATQTLTANVQLKEHNKLLLDMGKTLANSFKYSVSYGVLNNLTGAIQSAFNYTKALDSSLNDIRIVTDKSANDMERFAESANKAAKELGASTIDYTKASLIYYQQGLADEDVAARTDVTLKAANVTGQTTQEVSEQLTAVWNGYKVSAEEAELYVDKLAAVAATTASDLEELSTGMSKVASAANAMGVDVDQLNGMLSTIVSVTRQAPESAGTALKTIFARMGDLKIDGEDEFGVSLGEVSGQLAEVGVNIMNAKHELRDMGEVIEEVGQKWNSGVWSEAEKQAIAIELAGKRQYNNLLALFDNWDMYNKAVETSMSSQGTLQKQQDIYMESTAAHLQQMQTAWEGVKDVILKPDDVNPLIDVFGTFGEITKEAIEGLGGLKGVLTLLGTVGLQTFGPILGESLAGFISNLDIAKAQASALTTELQFTQQLKNGPYQNDEGVRFLVDEMEKLQGIYGNISTEQANMLKKLIETASEATNVKLQYEAIADAAAHAVNDKNKYTDTPTNYTGEELLKNNMWDVVQKASGEFEDASINVKAFSDSLRQSKQVTDDFDDEMQMVSQTIEKFGDKDQSIIDLGVEIQELANKVRTGEKPITDLADKLDILASGAKTTADQLDKVGSEMGEKYANSVVTAANATDTLHEKMKAGNIQNLTANIMKATGSIGQLTMGFTTLTSAIDSFRNKDISSGIISLTMALPMAINGMKTLGEVFGVTSTLTDVFTTKLAANTAATTAQIAAQELEAATQALSSQMDLGEIGSLTALATVRGINVTSMTAEKAMTQLLNIAQKENIALDSSGIKVLTAYIASKQADAAQTEKNTAAQNAWNASLLANPFTWVIAGLVAVAGAAIGVANAIRKANEAQAESALEQNSKIAKNLEEVKALNELQESYSKLLKTYKETGNNEDELREKGLELCDKYDLQAEKLEILAGRYDSLAESVKKYQTSTRDELNNANQLANTGDKALTAKMDSNLGFTGTLANSISSATGWEGQMVQLTSGFGKDDANARSILEKYSSVQDAAFKQTFLYFKDSQEAYENIGKALDEMAANDLETSAIYKNLKKQYDSLAEAASAYESGQQAQNEAILHQVESSGKGLQDFQDSLTYSESKYEDFTKRIQEFKDNLQVKFNSEGIERSTDDINKIVEDYLNSINSVYSVRYNAIEQLKEAAGGDIEEIENKLNSLSDKEFAFLLKIGFTGQESEEWIKKTLALMEEDSTPTITIDYVENIKKAVSDKNLTKKEAKEYSQNLSNATEENPTIYAGFSDRGKGDQFNILQQAENEAIAQRVEQMAVLLDQEENEAQLNALLTQTLEAQGHAQSELAERAKEVVISFQATAKSADENLQFNRNITNAAELQADIEAHKQSLRKEYNEEVAEELQKEEEILEAATKDNEAYQKAKDLLNDVTAEATTLKDRLEEAGNVDFSSIQTEAFDLIDSAIDTTLKKVDNLTTAAQLIGDGFKVAADDVDKLAESFPELFEGATVVAEDMMQLDKDVVQNFVNGKKEEIQAEIQSQLERLGIEKEMLEAEYETNQVKIGLMKDYLNDKIDQNKLEKGLTKANNEYQQNLSDITTKHGIENLVQAVSANKEAAEKTVQNIRNLFNAYQQLGACAAAALAGKKYDGTFDGGNFTSADLRGWQEHKDNNNFNEDESYYNEVFAQIQELESRQQEITGRLQNISVTEAKLNARMTETLGTLGRVGSGKAGKKSKKSGSSAQPDKKDLLHAEKEIDVYHDINLELEEIEHQMKMLQKAEDKAFGKNYLDNLNTQNKLLEKQKKLLKEKLQLTANDMATRRAQLAEMGVAFDEEGYMTNYNALLTERLNKYNELITAYNAMGAAQQKTSKQSIEDAKKEFDLLKERVSEYDKLFNSFNSLEEELQDKMDEQIENQIKAFNYEIDVRLDMAEATRNWNDFYEKVIEDIEGIEDPVKKIITSMQTGLKNFESYYNGRDGLGSIQYLTEHIRETMAQVESIKNTGTSSVYGDNMSAAAEDLKKYNDSLIENLEDAQDIINKIKDSYLDAIDEANDKLEEQTKQYEYIADLINHDMNMVELLGGEDDYADLARYYEMMHANNMQNVEFLRMQRDAIKAQLDAVEEGSEAWKKLYEQVQDAQKDLNSAVEDSLNNIIDKYSNAIKNVFDKLNKSVTSGLGLDYMQESYDRQVDNGNNYLDDPNRLYAIEKIRNKYKDALNSTSDLAAQRKIADVMAQQLKYLEEKDQLSQYEVERAEKIYDLTMKQIALQEAQANKSQLRLKRDAQGNYSYQYVADQDAMNDAQQEVNDAMNDLYNFDLENYRDILGQATELTKEYEELVTEILENAALSEEERTQRLAEVKNWYYTEMNALEEQLAINKVNLQESANMELEELYRQNNEIFQGVIFEEMVPGWNGALDEMVTNFTEDFIPRCEESMRDLEAETKQYQDEIDVLAAQAGVDFGLIKAGTDAVIGATQQLMQTNEAVIGTYNQEMSAIMGAVNAMEQLIQKYQEAQQQAIATADAAAKMWNALQLGAYSTTASAAIEGIANSIKDTAKELNSMGDAVSNTAKQVGAVEKEKEKTSNGYSIVVGGELVQHGLTKEEAYRVSAKIPNYGPSVSIMTDEDWWKRVGRFATGGYTGDWHSNDGKLAILDSKELVLNADDTKNMLDAVNVVRHIVASLDGSMNARVAGLAINPDISQALSQVGGASAIDQNVTISASFPNVSSHTEIEQAFENLVNRASQAAWSTRV